MNNIQNYIFYSFTDQDLNEISIANSRDFEIYLCTRIDRNIYVSCEKVVPEYLSLNRTHHVDTRKNKIERQFMDSSKSKTKTNFIDIGMLTPAKQHSIDFIEFVLLISIIIALIIALIIASIVAINETSKLNDVSDIAKKLCQKYNDRMCHVSIFD